MDKTFLSALIGALSMMAAQPALAQDVAASIVGTWKITSQVRKEVESGATANIFGTPAGHAVFTKGGHVVWFFVNGDRKAPASANLTDAERVHLFRTLAAGGGTYKVEGKKVIFHYDTSWHQLWTGTDVTTDAEISGKTLTLTNAPFKSPQDGKEVVVVTTWDRLE